MDNITKIPVDTFCDFNNGKIMLKNFGDDLNYLFLEKIIDGKFVQHTKNDGKINYSLIGSILCSYGFDKKTIVWGSGFIRNNKIVKRPLKICAVRGPLTRKKFINSGISCPEVYGDPALLLPYYYNPKIEKKYKIGIIKHWKTVEKLNKNLKYNKDVHDIFFNNYKKFEDVIDEILSCEYIVSESLHGLIIAEAYNIPNLWVDFDLEKREKSNFKFHDFFLSLGKDRKEPYKMTNKTTIDDLINELKKYEHINNLDIQKLIDSCPLKLKIKKNDKTYKNTKKDNNVNNNIINENTKQINNNENEIIVTNKNDNKKNNKNNIRYKKHDKSGFNFTDHLYV